MPPKSRRAAASVPVPLGRTKQLALKAYKDGDKAVIAQVDLESAVCEVGQWGQAAYGSSGATPGVWAAVDMDMLPALIALYGLALRRSSATLVPDVGEATRAAWATLRAKLTCELAELRHDNGKHMTRGHARAIAWAVLRGQALRCHAVLLSAAAAPLAPPAAPERRRSRPPRRSLQAAADALTEARQLMLLFYGVLDDDVVDTVGPGIIAKDGELLRELGSELQSSGLLEHWARLLLLLAACDGWQDEAATQLHEMAEPLAVFDFVELWQALDWRRSLRDVLQSSPSLAYLLSSHVVGLCAALDGGPTYGMPAATEAEESEPGAMAVAAPLFDTSGLRLRQRCAPKDIAADLAHWALALWSTAIQMERLDLSAAFRSAATADARAGQGEVGSEGRAGQGEDGSEGRAGQGGGGAEGRAGQGESGAEGRDAPPNMSLRALRRRTLAAATVQAPEPKTDVVPARAEWDNSLFATLPLHTGATFELCMRLAAAATEALAAPATGAQRSERVAVTRVAAKEASRLARQALRCGWQAMGEGLFCAVEAEPRTANRLRRWWAALVALVDAISAAEALHVDRWSWFGLEHCLAVTAPANLKDLPPRPSLCVAAALDAGYLPRLLVILRTLAGNSDTVLGFLLQPAESLRWAWDQILAFAAPCESVALLRLVADLLRDASKAIMRTGQGATLSGTTPFMNIMMLLGWWQGLGRQAVLDWQNGKDVVSPADVAAAQQVTHRTTAGGQRSDGRGEAGSSDVNSPGVRRLWLMLSYALVHLLPPVVHAIASGCVADSAEVRHLEFLGSLLVDLLMWATLLAAALSHARAHAAAAAEQSSATEGPSCQAGGGVAAEWRELLVALLPAVLGSALGLVVTGMGSDHAVRGLHRALSDMVDLVPREIGHALSLRSTGKVMARALASYEQAAGGGTVPSRRGLTVHGALTQLLTELRPDEELLQRVNAIVAAAGDADALAALQAKRDGDQRASGLAAAAVLLVPPSELERALG